MQDLRVLPSFIFESQDFTPYIGIGIGRQDKNMFLVKKCFLCTNKFSIFDLPSSLSLEQIFWQIMGQSISRVSR
jgi:hypothetical protein